MNISDLITFTDLLAHRDVDDRLDRIQRAGAYVSTTRNTVHSPSPLKVIGEILDELMCVPTDPPSLKVQVLAGKFWCRGALWGWPGATSIEIHPEIALPTFAYIGIRLDRVLNTMEMFVENTPGNMPAFHADVFPVALIKLPMGAESIIEDYIIDLRPFLNYDISIPKDKIVVEIACLAPGESNMVDLGRFRGGRPLISVYQQVPREGQSVIHHLFDSQEKITRLEGATTNAYYDASVQGATLPPRITTETIDMPATENVIFVSAIRGTTAADGTKNFPFNNIPDAVDRLNGMPGYDTIYIEEGIYDLKNEVSITVPARIIGISPIKTTIRMAQSRPRFGVVNEKTTFQTIQFQWAKTIAEGACCIEAMQEVSFFNCIFKITTPNPTIQFLISHHHRNISNCVFFNQYPGNMSTLPTLYNPKLSTDTWVERIENNVILGEWGQSFPSGFEYQNLFDTDVTGVNIGLEDNIKFYPSDSSPCIDQGMVTLVGADKDGTRTDIGLYGGGYASQARIKSYSVQDMVIFRYTFMTLFAPSLKYFMDVKPLVGFSLQMTNVRCAVSFDGGHRYVAWKDTVGSWALVNMDKFKDQANTPDELAARLVNIGDIPTKGEIVIAWGIWTDDAKHTPIIRGMDFNVKADGDALTPLWPDTIDLLISSESLLITNRGEDRLHNVVIVIY